MSGTTNNNFTDSFSDSNNNNNNSSSIKSDVKSDGDGTDVNINDNMADDSRKIFVGGLSWETGEEDLMKYFSNFGQVKSCVIKLDRFTNQSRGFGFVMFDSEESVSKVLEQKEHSLNKKKIDPKRAKPSREPQKKVFIGGLDPDVAEERIKTHFSQFGSIENVETPFDVKKNKRKRYLFITFSSEAEARKAAALEGQDIDGKKFEVRVAIPRDQANRSKEMTWRAAVNNMYYPYSVLPYMYPDYFYSSYIYSSAHPQMYNPYDYVNYDLSRQFQQTSINHQGSGNHNNQQIGSSQSPSNQHISGTISPNQQNSQNNTNNNNSNRNQYLAGSNNNNNNNVSSNDANNTANIPFAYYPYAVMHPGAHYSAQQNMMPNNLQKQQHTFQLPNGGIVNKNMNESM